MTSVSTTEEPVTSSKNIDFYARFVEAKLANDRNPEASKNS